MTYCIGIKTNEGIVLASDSRTNAGLDNVNIYSKMLTYDVGDRTVIIVTSGNLATSQAVFKSIEMLFTKWGPFHDCIFTVLSKNYKLFHF